MTVSAANALSPSSISSGVQFVRYAAVGAIGTGLHYAAMFSLIAAFAVEPVMASTSGAILGALANYALNHRFTFRSTASHQVAMPRFLLIATIGFGLNALLLGLLLHTTALSTAFAQLVATIGVLGFSFFANRSLTF